MEIWDLIGIVCLIAGFVLVGIEMVLPGFSVPGISGIICENAERYYDGRYFPSSRYRRHGRFRTRGRLSGKRQKTEFYNTTIER